MSGAPLAVQLVPIGVDGSVAKSAEDPSGAVAGVVEQTVALYRRRGHVPPWTCYLAEHRGAWVGTCGFAGPPADGEAEIAYFTFPGMEGRGVGRALTAALLSRCGRDAAREGIRFIARTLPEEGPSASILRRLGFSLQGVIQHPEDGAIWKWSRPRDARP